MAFDSKQGLSFTVCNWKIWEENTSEASGCRKQSQVYGPREGWFASPDSYSRCEHTGLPRNFVLTAWWKFMQINVSCHNSAFGTWKLCWFYKIKLSFYGEKYLELLCYSIQSCEHKYRLTSKSFPLSPCSSWWVPGML